MNYLEGTVVVVRNQKIKILKHMDVDYKTQLHLQKVGTNLCKKSISIGLLVATFSLDEMLLGIVYSDFDSGIKEVTSTTFFR
ncbi:hypothetical protein [Desulfosporosinus sp. Sb-LF]|uniref:hypothetical protein n=1 Tax=Desulfosporosinus sp. Sb-LF TaxID=2560027 RepID=UPI00130547EF|nr:hypothetical protein [Desulfosporosinus sp. Sb-LF]